MRECGWILASVVVFLCSLNAVYAASYYCNSCADCTSKIGSAASGDYVYLDTDVSSSGTCISFFRVRDINLDCLNHSITGTGSGYGIHVTEGGNNQIRNCQIKSFDSGVYLFSSLDNVLPEMP